jgi:hypothetical protein
MAETRPADASGGLRDASMVDGGERARRVDLLLDLCARARTSQRLSSNTRTVMEDTDDLLTAEQKEELTKARQGLLDATEHLQNAAELVITALKRDRS